MTAHRLAGHLSVDASARRVRHYRYVEERMMRVLGGWIALTPELPAKLLFGRHVWDCAQHADLWGRRLPELRAPAQQSEPAGEGVVRFFELLEAPEEPGRTVERVAGIYGVLKPHLATVYARHLAASNPVYEPPTRRILQSCLDEERRHAAAGAVVLARLTGDAAARARAAAWERRLLDALEAAAGVTGDVTAPLVDAPPPVPPEALAQDLVPVPPPFDPGAIPADLAAALRALGEAVTAGDPARAAGLADEAAADALGAAWAALPVPARVCTAVALASVGPRYRVVKLRVEGDRGAALLQLRWQRAAPGWRIVAADVVPASPPA
jgi:hypothetical protein